MQERTDRKPLSRRDFLRVAGTLAAGATLAACAPKTVVVKETIKETVIVEGTPKVVEKEVTKIVEKEVEKQVTKEVTRVVKETVEVAVEVYDLEYWAGWPQYDRVIGPLTSTPEWKEMTAPHNVTVRAGVSGEVFNANIAAGTPPEVAASSWERLRDGIILPLDDFVAASTIIVRENYPQATWDASTYEGQLFGVVCNEGFMTCGLDYNARMVEEAGLDPDNPPVTWEECYVWHEALTQFDSAGNLIQIGLDPLDAMGGGPPSWSWPFGMSFGCYDTWTYWDPDKVEIHFDHPEMAALFDTTARFIQLIGPDNLQGMRSVEGQGTWGGAYNSEVQAMIIEGYWHPGETMNEAPEVGKVNRATWVPVPESRRGKKVQALGGHKLGLFAQSKHPQAGWPIIEFLHTEAA